MFALERVGGGEGALRPNPSSAASETNTCDKVVPLYDQSVLLDDLETCALKKKEGKIPDIIRWRITLNEIWGNEIWHTEAQTWKYSDFHFRSLILIFINIYCHNVNDKLRPVVWFSFFAKGDSCRKSFYETKTISEPRSSRTRRWLLWSSAVDTLGPL